MPRPKSISIQLEGQRLRPEEKQLPQVREVDLHHKQQCSSAMMGANQNAILGVGSGNRDYNCMDKCTAVETLDI